MDFGNAAKITSRYLSDHAPAILTGFAVAGVVATTVLSVKGGMRAEQLLSQEHTRRLNEAEELDTEVLPISLKEGFFLTWRPFVPAALTLAGTVACVVGAQSINNNRQVALIGAYTLLEKGKKQYQEKVLEVVGEKKEELVRGAVAEEVLKENPISDRQIVFVGNGDQLFYDTYSGRYFESSREDIRRAINDLNGEILRGNSIDVNQFYHEIGLPANGVGAGMGWNDRNQIDVNFESKFAEDGRPCGVITFRNDPLPDFWKNFR